MPRKLTSAIRPQQTSKDITDQYVSLFTVDFAFGPAMDAGTPADPGPPPVRAVPPAPIPAGGVEIMLDKTAMNYRIMSSDEDGKTIEMSKRTVFHADWPPNVVQAIRQIQSFLESDAEAEGLLEPGNSTDNV